MQEAIQEILKEIEKRKINNQKDLDKLKAEISHKYKLKQEPRLIHLFLEASEKQRKKFSKILKTKPVRTISGVAPIALFAMPSNCPPQAKCIYCPGGVNSFFGTVPKSYTGNEPASRRAARNKYDPYLQIFNRLEHYALLNQNFDKAEIIIMGGTFPFYSKIYKKEFITYVYKALNDFSGIFFKNNKFQYEKFKKFYELP
ncbi:MAG: tRNA uridine(34) 5-carboxymethylaminomethyl modification radical SAM/GNAT enzyme Elp3, partial [Nanoarchaeota archaeon]